MIHKAPHSEKMVWIVKVNPDGSETYYFGKGKMTERRALGFCRSWEAYYRMNYEGEYRFITREEKAPGKIIHDYEPMLYWVLDNIGNVINTGPVDFRVAKEIVNSKEDYTMSEAC